MKIFGWHDMVTYQEPKRFPSKSLQDQNHQKAKMKITKRQRSKSPKGQVQNHQKVKNKFLEKLIFSSWGIGMAGIDAAVKPIARKVRKTWKISFYLGFVKIVIAFACNCFRCIAIVIIIGIKIIMIAAAAEDSPWSWLSPSTSLSAGCSVNHWERTRT